MTDIVERLELQAFVADKIQSGMKPLIMDCLEEITHLRCQYEALLNQAEMNARLLTENASLRADKENFWSQRNQYKREYEEAVSFAEKVRDDLSEEITRLRERLAETDEANRRVSDENQRIRQSIKEYLGNLARVTNDMLRETWEREVGDD